MPRRVSARTSASARCRPDTVAHMPCNPAIGGTAKGHLVREIDALGGLMGARDRRDRHSVQAAQSQPRPGRLVAARAGGQEVVRRVGEGRARSRAEHRVDHRPRRTHSRRARSRRRARDGRRRRRTRATRWSSRPARFSTDSFTSGRSSIRPGAPANRRRASWPTSLKSFGFEWGRLKTGTPPRLDRESIDFRSARRRRHVPGGARRRSAGAVFVSHAAAIARADRLPPDSHQRSRPRSGARATSIASPLFNGQIQGIGPRYCPSLEDKIVRFPDKERHQIFLEPEGLDAREIYVNGFSTSLPRDVQARSRARAAGTRGRRDAAAGLRGRVRLHPADGADAAARDEARRRAVSRRADQRHVRLRGGGRAGPGRRHQCRARVRGRSPASNCGATRRTSGFSSTT